MNKENGGAAFPTQMLNVPLHEAGDAKHDGMTLRDYFAAKAMQGMCAEGSYREDSYDNLAAWAYKQADAMLEQRNK